MPPTPRSSPPRSELPRLASSLPTRRRLVLVLGLGLGLANPNPNPDPNPDDDPNPNPNPNHNPNPNPNPKQRPPRRSGDPSTTSSPPPALGPSPAAAVSPAPALALSLSRAPTAAVSPATTARIDSPASPPGVPPVTSPVGVPPLPPWLLAAQGGRLLAARRLSAERETAQWALYVACFWPLHVWKRAVRSARQARARASLTTVLWRGLTRLRLFRAWARLPRQQRAELDALRARLRLRVLASALRRWFDWDYEAGYEARMLESLACVALKARAVCAMPLLALRLYARFRLLVRSRSYPPLMLCDEAQVPPLLLAQLVPLEQLPLRRGDLPYPLSIAPAWECDHLARCVNRMRRARLAPILLHVLRQHVLRRRRKRWARARGWALLLGRILQVRARVRVRVRVRVRARARVSLMLDPNVIARSRLAAVGALRAGRPRRNRRGGGRQRRGRRGRRWRRRRRRRSRQRRCWRRVLSEPAPRLGRGAQRGDAHTWPVHSRAPNPNPDPDPDLNAYNTHHAHIRPVPSSAPSPNPNPNPGPDPSPNPARYLKQRHGLLEASARS